jgi:hypothetical protein
MTRIQTGLLLFLLLAANPVAAEIYRYIDESGVLSFTDDLSKVPPDQRPKVEVVEPGTGPRPDFLSGPSAFEQLRDHPAVKPVAAGVIGLMLLLIARTFLGGAVLRYLASVVLVSAAGAALYWLSLSSGCGSKEIEQHVPVGNPLQRAQDQADRFEQRNATQERMIEEQTREQKRATSP